MKRTEIISRIVICLYLMATAGSPTSAQDATKPNAPQTPATESLPPLQLDGDAVLHHLNAVISWYRHSTSGIRDVGLPSDAIYQDSAQSLGAQAVQLAFQSAKAESTLIAKQQTGGSNQGAQDNTQQQKLEALKAKTSSQIDELQKQIESLTAKIPKTSVSKRTALLAQRDALQSELDLQKTLLDAVQKMSAFVESIGEAGRGLEGDINRLAQSIPEVINHPNAEKAGSTQDKIAAAKSTAKPSLTNSGGLIGDSMTLYDYMSAVHEN